MIEDFHGYRTGAWSAPRQITPVIVPCIVDETATLCWQLAQLAEHVASIMLDDCNERGPVRPRPIECFEPAERDLIRQGMRALGFETVPDDRNVWDRSHAAAVLQVAAAGGVMVYDYGALSAAWIISLVEAIETHGTGRDWRSPAARGAP